MYRKFSHANGKYAGEGKRVRILAWFFIIITAIAIGRLFDLQVLKGDFYAALASGQHELYQRLFPERGSIYVVENAGGKQVLFPLVTNQKLSTLYAVPVSITDPTSTAETLYGVIGPSEGVEGEYKQYLASSTEAVSAAVSDGTLGGFSGIMDRKAFEVGKLIAVLSKPGRRYEVIRRKVPEDVIAKIKALDLAGIGASEEVWRYYPEQGMGGHIFGFLGYSGDERVGMYGLEGYFNKELSGEFGEIRSQRDAVGNMLAVGDSSIKDKTDGSDLVLTIDRAIQFKACQELYLQVQNTKAKGGSIVVMEPKTGAILAMCSFPDYDPGKYSKVDGAAVYNNPAIFTAFEPGSVFKAITMAAAIDAGKISPDTAYVDTGVSDYGKYKIRNYNDKVYGRQTMTGVLENSINTGVIFAMKAMGTQAFAKYVRAFGFGEYTGIELSKEAPGNVANLNTKSEINFATATFGQGITATPLQMVTAVSAIVNGGKLMKPYIVSQVVSSDKKVQNFSPKVVREVISPRSSSLVSAMLVSVVETGHANGAKIPGYRIGGKTGTAQVPKKGGGYQDDSVVNTSFVGFAPYKDPKFVMYVNIMEPQTLRTGEGSASPVFGAVGKFILQYYNVPYDNPGDPRLPR